MAAQPDFQKLSNGMITAGQEMLKLQNIPAIDQPRTLHDEIAALEREMNEQFGRLNDKFEKLDLHMKVDAINQVARVCNSHITSLETKLQVLHNERNEAVYGFPENLTELAGLNDTSISNLLNAFSLPTDGAVAMKKRRFEYFIGVVINA